MKKFILFLIFIIFLSGCSFLNLNDFVLPNDIEFINTIENLDTPEKICNYMKDNFTYKPNAIYNLDPYDLWLSQKGDCNDFATFAIFVANYHNYITCQISIHFKRTFMTHVLAVYLENNKYTYSNNKAYYPINVSTFKEIVEHYFNFPIEYELDYYKVFDYNMNLIEKNYAL